MKPVKVLVTGSAGQLALSLRERASRMPRLDIHFAGRPLLDLYERATVERQIAAIQPDVVINAAAYTAVDKAEAEPELAWRANAVAPGWIAAAVAKRGGRLIQISTDYVYDGRKDRSYVESDPTDPLSVYGRSKLAGEEEVRAALPDHVILRTAWVYSPFGRNFVKSILALARTRDRLSVVDDQLGRPTSSLDLATAVLSILERWREDAAAGLSQTYHATGSGPTVSWCGVARRVYETSRAMGGPAAEVDPISTAQWQAAATRPANSVLHCAKLARDFGIALPDWRQSLDDVVTQLIRSAPAIG